MEIALPLMALGGMYVVANSADETARDSEGFTNMGKPKNALPGVVPPLPARNFPKTQGVPASAVDRYPNANQATDKYFDQNVYERVMAQNPPGDVGTGRQPQMSLTGQPIDPQDFKHANMVPFFGAKIKGATVNADIAEGVLDNMQGAGSQLIRKREAAPLFKPQKDLGFAHGAPNSSAFMLSRVNPGTRMANVKPWAEEKVAPGLGRGFTTEGGPGFNSGMEDRDAWLPKTVNELRVDTNPKMTFGLEGHQGPAIAAVSDPATKATQGQVAKYRPDTDYKVGASRWFTTTGLEHAPTARGIEVLQPQNRPETQCDYYGPRDGETEAGYVQGKYRAPKRNELGPEQLPPAAAEGRQGVAAGDREIQSYHLLANNRETTRQGTEFGVVGGAVKAIVAPILDLLRPSRKEDVVGNLRGTGNAHSNVANVPVYNPADRTRTTIREMTEGKLDGTHLNLDGEHAGGYQVASQQPVTVHRDTTNCSYTGDPGPGTNGASQNYYAAYQQRNNPYKSNRNRPNQGGTQIFNQQDCIQVRKREADACNGSTWAPVAGPATTPSLETLGKVNMPQYYEEPQGCSRINPDILKAFKENPYTQSLASYAAP